jgi:hypothetical protein
VNVSWKTIKELLFVIMTSKNFSLGIFCTDWFM